MAFCASCGAEAKGNFCEQCGASLSSPDATIRLSNEERSNELPENLACALCYFLWAVSGVFFLAWPPYSLNRRIRFHAIQSILFTAAWMLLSLTVAVILPQALSQIVAPVLLLGILALWVHIMWQLHKGHEVTLPVLGDLAKKQA